MSEDPTTITDTTTTAAAATSADASFPGLQSYRQMKTHFPSARIKKLLQSDEDIGKVAQATPLVVGRAVELFMCALVEKTLEQGTGQGSKKVPVSVLKSVIDNNEEFDFLLDVCDKYTAPHTGNAAPPPQQGQIHSENNTLEQQHTHSDDFSE